MIDDWNKQFCLISEWLTQFCCHIVEADFVVYSRIGVVRVPCKKFVTQQTQAFVFTTYLELFYFFALLRLLRGTTMEKTYLNIHFSNREKELQQIVKLWVLLHTQTWTDDTCEFSDSPLSTACSFSRLRISGLAALMSIFRLEVGVQGSLDGASRPLVGVVRGPMLLWLSSDEASDAEALFEFFSGVCGSTKTCLCYIENTKVHHGHNHTYFSKNAYFM